MEPALVVVVVIAGSSKPEDIEAAVRNALRDIKIPKPEDPAWMEVGGLKFDNQSVTVVGMNGERLPLTAGEYIVLRELAENPGVTISRTRLFDRFKGKYTQKISSNERSVDTLISNIRPKIAAAGAQMSIDTIYGVGYRLEQSASKKLGGS